jgi:ketosteroid isomerase-like protein
MKKAFYLLIVAVFAINACQPKVQTKPVDLPAVKENVNIWMDKYIDLLNKKDVQGMASKLTEDCLILGTDPSEYFNKKMLTDAWEQMVADTAVKFTFKADKREIRVATDGNSAIVVDQYMIESMSKKIAVRADYHLIKNGDDWAIDFSNMGLIPKNEDIPKLNKALE